MDRITIEATDNGYVVTVEIANCASTKKVFTSHLKMIRYVREQVRKAHEAEAAE